MEGSLVDPEDYLEVDLAAETVGMRDGLPTSPSTRKSGYPIRSLFQSKCTKTFRYQWRCPLPWKSTSPTLFQWLSPIPCTSIGPTQWRYHLGNGFNEHPPALVCFKVYKNIPVPVKVPYKVEVPYKVAVHVPKPVPVFVHKPVPVHVHEINIVKKPVPVFVGNNEELETSHAQFCWIMGFRWSWKWWWLWRARIIRFWKLWIPLESRESLHLVTTT